MRAVAGPRDVQRRIDAAARRKDRSRASAFRRVIQSIPKGKVSTYGKVAAAAGYPLYHRAVARLLQQEGLHGLPWQRVVGAGGVLRLRGDAALEQRLRLTVEGVRFRGKHVDMQVHEHSFETWELADMALPSPE